MDFVLGFFYDFWLNSGRKWHFTKLFCLKATSFCLKTTLFCHKTTLFCHKTTLSCSKTTLSWNKTEVFCSKTTLRWSKAKVFWLKATLSWIKTIVFWSKTTLSCFRTTLRWTKTEVFCVKTTLSCPMQTTHKEPLRWHSHKSIPCFGDGAATFSGYLQLSASGRLWTHYANQFLQKLCLCHGSIVSLGRKKIILIKS